MDRAADEPPLDIIICTCSSPPPPSGKGCDNAVECLVDRAADEPLDIICSCSSAFCFGCKEEAHRPVRRGGVAVLGSRPVRGAGRRGESMQGQRGRRGEGRSGGACIGAQAGEGMEVPHRGAGRWGVRRRSLSGAQAGGG